MKIAVISDIHSNIFALEKVFEDIEKNSIETIINLGDILYGPIAPLETYELLKKKEIITISGNQDRQLYESTKKEIDKNPTLKFILEDLSDEAISWIKALPFDKQLSKDIYLCHGTPNDDLEYLLEDISTGFAKLREDKEILKRLNGNKTNLILCGHTHTPRTVYTSSNQIIVNPGSVGLPAYTDKEPIKHSMQTFSNHSSYCIIEKIEENKYNVNHKKIAYDYKKACNEAKKRNRLDWVHFLSTGRGLL